MAQKVVMPQMGESVVQGTVAKWLVKEGDRVKEDQPVVEVSTDKVDVEIPSPAEGVLSQILVREGQTVDVGTDLALIDAGQAAAASPSAKTPETAKGPAEEPSARPPEPVQESSELEERRRLSPLVRRLSKEHGVDPASLKGTGLGGRVTKDDILRSTARSAEEKPAEVPLNSESSKAQPPKTRSAPAGPPGVAEYTPPRSEVKEGDEVVPFTRMRKLIAAHMVSSKRTAAHVTAVAEVDVSEIVRLRREHGARLKEKEGIELTFLPFIIVGTVGALKEYRVLNATVLDDQIIIKKEINIGIAVDTQEGLIVPVLHQADELSILGIAKAIGELGEKARQRRLSPQEISAGTFTVTNPGRKGNLFGTPIIFQPQVGILRMGEVKKRPAVIEVNGEDALAIRSLMYLSLSYDHRVIDGVTANGFLHRTRELLEKGSFGL